MSQFTGSLHHCFHSCILTLHICHILLVFLTKVVSTRKIMDQSTHMFTVIVWLIDPENVTAWHLQQNADKFYKANACVLSAVECNIVYLSAVATHLAHTVKKKALLVHLRLFDNSWMPNNKQWWSGLNCNPIRRENVSSIVLVKVNGLTHRALLDTLATASYASGYISDWLRMAACQDRESSVNDHFGELLIFCPTIPFGKLFSKIKFKSSDDY